MQPHKYIIRGQHISPRRLLVAAAAETGSGAEVAATFTVPSYGTSFGEHLRLVGDLEALGSWDVAAGLVLEWGEGNTWSGSAQLPAGATEFKVVKVLGDGSAEWEGWANRTIEIPAGSGVTVTVNAGDGSTDVSHSSAAAATQPAPAAEGAESGSGQAEVLDQSTGVSTEAAADEALSHGFTVQSDGEDGEAASEEPAVESEEADLVVENLIGGEAHPGDAPAAAETSPSEQPAAGAAATEQPPSQAEEQQPQDQAGDRGAADPGAVAGDTGTELDAVNLNGSGEEEAIEEQQQQPPPAEVDDTATGDNDNDNAAAAAEAASAHGDGQFLGRRDVAVAEDGTITFSLDPADAELQQLAADILARLQGQ